MLLQFNDLSLVPPRGWEFEQPELHWKNLNPVQIPFWSLVGIVRELRQNNPRYNLPTDEEIIALEIQAFNCPKVPDRCRGWEPPPQQVAQQGVIVETVRRKGGRRSGGCRSCGK